MSDAEYNAISGGDETDRMQRGMQDKKINLCYLTAGQLLELYESKTVSPVEVVKAVFQRIDDVDGEVNAFSLRNEAMALKAAKDSERRWFADEPSGLLDGVPVTVKDIVMSRDWPMLRGSKAVSEDQPCDEDAPVVARLREQGAIFIGRTTTPEFGWKGVTDSPLTGITRNPWNTECTPGGSSGGAAVAAALGMGALHIGTDGGGSIRIPAGFTGVFGFKPSFGRVPLYPPSAFGTLSHIGPITRTVSDAALMMNVLVLPDSRDPHALPYDHGEYEVGSDIDIERLRIAYSPTLGYVDVDKEVAACVKATVDSLSELGATVEEVDPGFENPLDCFNKHWYPGAAHLLERFSPEQQALMDPGFLEIAREGAEVSLAEYMTAVDQRVELAQRMNAFHDQYDLLVTPSLPCPAFKAGDPVADLQAQNRWPDWTPFTYPFNLTGQPACSVPCGFTKAGLPVGLQLVGPQHADPLVLGVAHAFEAMRPFVTPDQPNPK